MNYHYRNTAPALSRYIRSVLVIEGMQDAGSTNLPLFTNGMPALLCESKNGYHTITIYSQSVPDEKLKAENEDSCILYFFKPFALGTIFKLPVEKLKENAITFHSLDRVKAETLEQNLANTSSKEKIEALDNLILAQLRSNQRECEIIQYTTDLMMQDQSPEVLARIHLELDIAERTFQRIFKKYVGITPNKYRRICQFYFAFSQLKGKHFDKLTDVVYNNGYFDQSHYIRSFKEFTDTTPNDYLQFGLEKN